MNNKMPRLDCTDVYADLDLHCLQIASGPFSCIAYLMVYKNIEDLDHNVHHQSLVRVDGF